MVTDGFTFHPGSGTSAVFEDERFKKRLMILKKYVDENQDLQMDVLYALQEHWILRSFVRS